MPGEKKARVRQSRTKEEKRAKRVDWKRLPGRVIEDGFTWAARGLEDSGQLMS
jgi:hypothetical protein